jgi:glyoxylase-like metal-dependent hydrolase (beta-lactamase superfamily II)
MAAAEVYEVERINQAVARLPLPLPLRELPTVNCYAIFGADGLTLLDPGWKSESTEKVLVRHLAALGARPGDVRRILVTHAHWDHYTQALDWQARYGVEVWLGRPEQHSIASLDLSRGPHPRQAEMLRLAGAPALADAVDRLPIEDHERGIPFGPADQWVDDAARIDCGGPVLTARATPGHTRGHIVYELAGLLFTGDHVLPSITPSLAFEQAPEDQPLGSFLRSLRRLLDGPDRMLLPAHGPVAASVQDRVVELLGHHDRRLKETHDHVAAGARSACDVARRMPWTRHEKTLSELGTVHAMTAILEVRAHLRYLVADGRLTMRGDAVETYATV